MSSNHGEVGARPTMDLAAYRNPPDLDKGAGFAKRAVWHFVNAIVLQNPMVVSSRLKVAVLRLFGATIGQRTIVKPSVNIKAPWLLILGDDVWLGERCWIDSLAQVTIGNNVCLSQDVYLCCGNHDWTSPRFDKSVSPITIEDGVWVATRATVMGGAHLRSHCVITAGSIFSKDSEPYSIYAGSPAIKVKDRKISDKG